MTQNKIKGKVIVGMSGGVDSAAAAYILQQDGFEVIGATLRTWEGENNRCCEIDKARNIAFKLGIKYYPWNVADSFHEHVIKPFAQEYTQGRTPNPCIECNPYVKWAGLQHIAKVMQADFVATGHYANIKFLNNGRFAVQQAADKRKDQSYMLYKLTQNQLAHTMFPLGNLTKEESRQIVAKFDIDTSNQAESQEICFITDESYDEYLEREIGAFAEGNFVDENGNILGKHRGIARYTIGQRKGLGLALGYPAYVKAILPSTNEIVVGKESALYTNNIICDRLSFMGISETKSEPFRALVKTRYRHKGVHGKAERIEEDKMSITFDEPVRAATPGQSAVFYNDDGCILGGGRIIS